MYKKKWMLKLIMISLVLFSVLGLSAQDATFFTTVFETETLTWEQAAFLVMAGSGRVTDTTTSVQAWESLSKTQWYTNIPDRLSPITVGQFSLLLSKAFNVKGGLFFTLFSGERYAYRELVYKRVVPGSADPYALIKGTDAMKMLEKAITFFPIETETQTEGVK